MSSIKPRTKKGRKISDFDCATCDHNIRLCRKQSAKIAALEKRLEAAEAVIEKAKDVMDVIAFRCRINDGHFARQKIDEFFDFANDKLISGTARRQGNGCKLEVALFLPIEWGHL